MKKIEAIVGTAEGARSSIKKAFTEAIASKDEVIVRASAVEAKLGILFVEKELATQALLVEKMARANAKWAL